MKAAAAEVLDVAGTSEANISPRDAGPDRANVRVGVLAAVVVRPDIGGEWVAAALARASRVGVRLAIAGDSDYKCPATAVRHAAVDHALAAAVENHARATFPHSCIVVVHARAADSEFARAIFDGVVLVARSALLDASRFAARVNAALAIRVGLAVGARARTVTA